MAWPGYESSLIGPPACDQFGLQLRRDIRTRTLGVAVDLVPGGIGESSASRIALEPAGVN